MMTRLDFPIGTKVSIDNVVDGVVNGYYRDLVMVELDNYMSKPHKFNLWWRATRELDNKQLTISVIPVHPENLTRR